MADYININGNNIPIRASDPSNPILGEIWYNSTTNLLKGQGFQAAAWTSSGALNTARSRSTSFGIQTDAVITSGGGGPVRPATEEYNGSTWTTSPGTRATSVWESASFGANSAAGLAFGGEPNTSAAESYNGTTWSSAPSIPTGMKPGRSQAGTYAAGMHNGGGTPTGTGGDDGNGNFLISNDWTGLAWTANPNMPTASDGGSCGPATAALQAGGGYLLSPGLATAEWDGSAWTTGINKNYPSGNNVSGTGPTNAIIANPGGAPTSTQAEITDGTTFTITASSSNAYSSRAGAGTASATFLAGGEPPDYRTETEDFTGAAAATVTISSS
jgi:hypothetical protein